MHLHPPELHDRTEARRAGGSDEAVPPGAPRSRLRRRVMWVGGALLLLSLLVLTPPLVNANRYRNKIAESMSKSLGRPVHLDGVSLHLLPTPGFTLHNLVVSEDPAFGAEPTIRANSVEASLRIGSLWHRPVEFSTVRFVEPSVNLVRNGEGRWNLSDVLLHASRVQSAPTAQRHAGPTPRFPYIEATGGRVNVKIGAEKLPFALTDADFALWLPSPQQWRVRLVGQPARTDRNITDPGRLRIEGELRRAETIDTVPVHFTTSWHDVPLGEATRILEGEDWGWRGTLNVDATLDGVLGGATMGAKMTLGGLRRGEFFPAHPLDLQVSCGSQLRVHPATLSALRCSLPDDAAQPMTLTAETVHLQAGRANNATVRAEAVPVRWALLWAALFSARVRTDLAPTGTMDIELEHHIAPEALTPVVSVPGGRGRTSRRRPAGAPMPAPTTPGAASWTGHVRVNLPAAEGESIAALNRLEWTVIPPGAGENWPGFRLLPVPVTMSQGATVTMSGSLGQSGYQLSLNGTAAPAALLLPARYLPELGDGLEAVLPFPPTGATPIHVQVTCTRSWHAAQQCTGPDATPGRGSALVPISVGVPASPSATQGSTPVLAPRNLSPLERAPFSTPRPMAPSNPQ